MLDAFAPDRLLGRTVLVLGLGRFSGGVETARYVVGAGARCVISDVAAPADLEASATEAQAIGAEVLFGPQTSALLEGVDAVIASPAMPFDHPVLETARTRGVPVTTEVAIVLARCPAPVFGVTGTKGKSTTAALLAGMLEATGRRVFLGGNIGRALIGCLPEIGADDCVVLELSSFQLWWTGAAGVSPPIALATNLFPDHLDRHGTMQAYALAKRAVFDFQGPDDIAVLPSSDPAVHGAGWHAAGAARRVTYGPGGHYTRTGLRILGPDLSIDVSGFPLLGRHNRHNLLAAASAAIASGLAGSEHVRSGALSARPLPHRMEPIGERDGVLYVDDSNATNPRSTLCALESFDRPVIVLLGGKDKGIDPAALLDGVRGRARAVIGLGTTGPALVEALGGAVTTSTARDMHDAVRIAATLAVPGDVVLLSPAYSSLDEYPSFAARGDRFRAAVRALDGAARRA